MPRIYNSANEPLDFCRRHFPKTEAVAEKLYGNAGSGPDDRGNCFGYECEHPPYDGCEYDCEICGRRLTDDDN